MRELTLDEMAEIRGGDSCSDAAWKTVRNIALGTAFTVAIAGWSLAFFVGSSIVLKGMFIADIVNLVHACGS